MTILRDAHPKARRDHCCDTCSRTIARGETYRRTTSLGDDGLYEFLECAHCRHLMRAMPDGLRDWIDPDFGYGQDDVIEWAHNGEASCPPAATLRQLYLARWENVTPDEVAELIAAVDKHLADHASP